MSLSSLIVQREVATIRQVEEALARQVIYGGDLVTNLLEVAKVDEAKLSTLLAESVGMKLASVGELPAPSDKARALVPREMALERAMLPMDVEDERLIVAVAEALPSEAEEQLAFALGLKIDQRIAPMVRVRQALARAYDVQLERRMQRLLARLGGSEPVSTGSTPPLLGKAPTVPEPPRMPSNPPFRMSPAVGLSQVNLPPAVPRRQTISGFPAVQGPALPLEKPPSSAPPATPVSATHPPANVKPMLLQRGVVTARPVRRRRGPLTLDKAKQEAEAASDRDVLLDLFFDFARQFFDYAALFLVHGDIAEGREAFGVGASRDRVLGIGVPLDLPSLLASAREKKQVITARPSSDGLDAVLLSDLQRDVNVTVCVVPLVVRTRAVALLLGDCGEQGVDTTALEEVTVFAQVIGHAFEKMIVKRKLSGFVAGTGPADTGRVDVSLVSKKSVPAPPVTHRSSDQVPAVANEEHRVIVAEMPFGISPSAFPPPPPQVAAVRRPTGPPIPREDPPSDPAPKMESGPKIESQSMDDATARALLDEISREEHVDAAPSSSAIAVPPHRPPSSRANEGSELPSVIVDMDTELGSLVDTFATGEDENAEAELLRQGQRAMPAIMARFPGPIHSARAEGMPRVSDYGPILRLVAGQRKVALPFVIERTRDVDAEKRYWATFLLTELHYPEAAAAVVPRLFDQETRTRRVARLAAQAIAKTHPDAMVEALALVALEADHVRRTAAIETLGELREPLAVPALTRVMAEGDEDTQELAYSALVATTRQDFGLDARKWSTWWTAHQTRHRIEWLIDALDQESAELRQAAGEELRALTKEYFGFAPDLPPRERQRAQQRYRDWWVTEGRSRFRRR